MSFRKIRLDPLPQEMSGLRLDRALALIPEISSRSQAAILIENKNVLVNGKAAKSSLLLSPHDIIEVELPPPPPTDLVAWEYPLEIMYEDEDLIVVNKPAGLVVHPAAGHHSDTLVNALLAHTINLSSGSDVMRPGLVHRIDKETSGILVVAKNNLSHEHLSLQFKNRTVDRKYFALTEGKFKFSIGSIESYLARHPTHRKKFASVRLKKDTQPAGKWAKTNYKVLSTSGSRNYIELKLETGRTHQIRVHLAEMGCPIVGDSLYGSKAELHRFLLHAAELGFIHPQTGEKMFFKKDWPLEDRQLIESWGLQIGND